MKRVLCVIAVVGGILAAGTAGGIGSYHLALAAGTSKDAALLLDMLTGMVVGSVLAFVAIQRWWA